MERLAFATVAVNSKNYGDAYLVQQERLIKSIQLHHPEAEIFRWSNSYPPGARDWLTSSYGFKPHAVQAAREAGYTRIVYMDSAMILQAPLDCQPLTEKYGVLAVKDDSNLAQVTSNNACKLYGVTREWLEGKNLVGGSFYYFDFESKLCEGIFGLWKWGEQNNAFGSQDEESAGLLQGHRHDEACMAICLYQYGSRPVTYEEVGYQGRIMKKEHFR